MTSNKPAAMRKAVDTEFMHLYELSLIALHSLFSSEYSQRLEHHNQSNGPTKFINYILTLLFLGMTECCDSIWVRSGW